MQSYGQAENVLQKRSRHTITAPIVFGINSVGDALTVSVVQSFEDDDIVKAFCKVCDENGLDVTCRDMGIEVTDTLEKDSVKLL